MVKEKSKNEKPKKISKKTPKTKSPILAVKTEEKKEIQKPSKYFEAVGKRKTAIARVRLFTNGEKEFLVNGKNSLQYFQTPELQDIAQSSLSKMKCLDKFRTLVLVKGGGKRVQAEAIRHGTARALIKFNQDFRKRLRRVGYLTRDPRVRERKKFGLRRARRAKQWRKR